MNNLFVLEINASIGARNMTIFPVVVKDVNELILIDTGLPGQIELFKTAAGNKGINLENLTKILITHHDIDHIGSLPAMKKAFKKAKVFSSAIEADYISGKKESIRLELSKRNYDKLPEEQKAYAKNFQKMFENIERTTVDVQLTEDGLLTGCAKTKVIHTPGHLPGHMSVYFEETKTLITGDALGLVDNKLFINPQNAIDMELAKKSVSKLLDYDITNVICYHGGLFEGDCRKAFQDIITQ
jgi:glyoxylase-like metal-dependent hydrolase (beta-lactamase superfamily II)